MSYVINISQASLFAKKSGYKINSNQVSCYYMEGQTSYVQAVFVLLRSLYWSSEEGLHTWLLLQSMWLCKVCMLVHMVLQPGISTPNVLSYTRILGSWLSLCDTQMHYLQLGASHLEHLKKQKEHSVLFLGGTTSSRPRCVAVSASVCNVNFYSFMVCNSFTCCIFLPMLPWTSMDLVLEGFDWLIDHMLMLTAV